MKCTKYNDTHQRKWRMISSRGPFTVTRPLALNVYKVADAAADIVSAPVLDDIPPQIFSPPPPPPSTTYTLKAPSVNAYPSNSPTLTAPEGVATPNFELPELPKLEISDVELPKLESLSVANEALSKASSDATAAASKLVGGVTGAASGLADNVTDVFSGLGDQVSGATGSLTSSIVEATGSLSDSLSDAKSALTGTVAGTTGALVDSVSSVTKDLTEQLGQKTQVASEAAGKLVGSIDSAVQGFTSATMQGVDNVKSIADSELQVVSQTLQQFVDSLPPEVKIAAKAGLNAASEGANAVALLAKKNPDEAAVVAGSVALSLLLSIIYKSRPDPLYAGDLDPSTVRALLQEDFSQVNNDQLSQTGDYVLIDIRKISERLSDGVPEFKKSARFKVAALPLAATEPLMTKSANDKNKLRIQLAATLISGLRIVKSNQNNVIIMESKGSDLAKDVAKALRKEGVYRAYVMKGGFSEWLKEGLPVDPSPDYNASASLYLKDELESIAEEAVDTWERLQNPEFALPVLGTTAAAAFALINYHTTLQAIGLWVLAYAVYNGSALEAIKGVAGGVGGVIGGVGSFAAVGSSSSGSSKGRKEASTSTVLSVPDSASMVMTTNEIMSSALESNVGGEAVVFEQVAATEEAPMSEEVPQQEIPVAAEL